MTTVTQTFNGAVTANSFSGVGSALTNLTRANIATGTANHVLINGAGGALSSEAQLSTVRGGTGLDTSASTGLVRITAGTWASGYQIVDADVNATAAITRTKLANGTANHVVINTAGGALSSEAQLSTARGGLGADFSATGAGPFIVTASSGAFTATLQYGTASVANTIVQRDGSGNVALGAVTATSVQTPTITSTGNITLTPTTGVVLFGTSVINQVPTGIAGSAINSYSASVQTTNATATTLFGLATTTGNSYYAFVNISAANTTSTTDTASYQYHVKFKNIGGTLTASLFNLITAADTSLTSATVTAVVSGTTLNFTVTGIAATTIKWCGSFDIVSQTL